MASRKRRMKNQISQQNKHRKIEQTERSTEPMKITDLNFDCLEKIFRNLALDDLMNVCDSNKWLNQVANSVCRLKYGQRYIIDFNNYNRYYLGFDLNRVTRIVGLKKSLRFLRCFGGVIEACLVLASKNSSYNSHMNRYFEEYCAKSLEAFFFVDWPTLPQLSSFDGLTFLSMMGNHFSRCINEHLLYLQILYYRDHNMRNYGISKIFQKLPQFNPRLRILRIEFINGSTTLNGLLNPLGNCPSVTVLSVKGDIAHCSLGQRSLAKFSKAFPSLLRFDLLSTDNREVSVDVIMRYVHQLRTVVELNFCKRAGHEITLALRERLSAEWQIIYENSIIKLKRHGVVDALNVHHQIFGLYSSLSSHQSV